MAVDEKARTLKKTLKLEKSIILGFCGLKAGDTTYLLFDLKTMKTMGWRGDVGFIRTEQKIKWHEVKFMYLQQQVTGVPEHWDAVRRLAD